MSKLLKDELGEAFINQLEKLIYSADFEPERDEFLKILGQKKYFQKELKERIDIIATTFDQVIPGHYEQQIQYLDLFADQFRGLQGFVFPQFIKIYGIDHPEVSLKYIKKWTEYSTGEFAIRPFLIKYPRAIEKMKLWSKDSNEHVRRLSSEGMRPFLPWAERLNFVLENPQANFEILENLKYDTSKYVRKSVANHLNDLSKFLPEEVVNTCQSWLIENQRKKEKVSSSMIKHGLRTLLKNSHSKALSLFGYQSDIDITYEVDFIPKVINVPDKGVLSLNITNLEEKNILLRVEYILEFLRGKDKYHPKVFMLKEFTLNKKETIKIEKTIQFKQLSTRKLHSGTHYIYLQINGIKTDKIKFELKV